MQFLSIQEFLLKGYILIIRHLIGLPSFSTTLTLSLNLSKALLKWYANSPLRVESTNMTLWYLWLSYHVLAYPIFSESFQRHPMICSCKRRKIQFLSLRMFVSNIFKAPLHTLILFYDCIPRTVCGELTVLCVSLIH